MRCNPHIGARLKALSAALSQEANRRTAEVGLTGSQAFFIGYLICHRSQPVYPRDLEREFDFSHPTVSGILSRLEKKGFVEFQPGESDRRRKQILVTAEGELAHAAVIRQLDAIEQQVLSGMNETEIREFHRLLAMAMQNLGATMGCHPHHEEEETR